MPLGRSERSNGGLQEKRVIDNNQFCKEHDIQTSHGIPARDTLVVSTSVECSSADSQRTASRGYSENGSFKSFSLRGQWRADVSGRL